MEVIERKNFVLYKVNWLHAHLGSVLTPLVITDFYYFPFSKSSVSDEVRILQIFSFKLSTIHLNFSLL